MSSCRLVRVFCKKETNQKVEALRKELELKEKELTIKNSKLNTLLQDPIGVIKLLATNYYNLRRSIEGFSIIGNRRAIGTRQFSSDEAKEAVKEAVEEAGGAEEAKAAVTEAVDEAVDEAGGAEEAKEAVKEAGRIKTFLLDNYGINVENCHENNLERKRDIRDFVTCCYETYIENNTETIEFTTTNENATLTKDIVDKTPTSKNKFYSVSIIGYETIGLNAFYDYKFVELTIDDKTVKYIDQGAFVQFSIQPILKKLTIPDSVETIGLDAFYNCNALKELTIGNSVTTIGNSVTTIGEYAFFNCSKLEELTIPDKVETIGKGAFYGCGTLELVIPDSVTSIGIEAFAFCFALKKLSIGNPSVKLTIGENAFYDCTALTEVIISDETAKILNKDWSSPSTVSSFYGSSNPVNFILPSE